MTQDLREAMAAEAPGGEAPPLAGMWRSARRRTQRRRLAVMGVPVASAAALLGGLVLVDRPGADAPVPLAVDQRSCDLIARVRAGDAPAGSLRTARPPADAAEMVGRSTPSGYGTPEGASLRPTVVRIRIERVEPADLSGLSVRWTDDLTARVVEPVQPADASGTIRVQTFRTDFWDDMSAATRMVQRDIDGVQDDIDAASAPLAALDQQIAQTPASDPAHAGLLDQRRREEARSQERRDALEAELADYQQRLQMLQLGERLLLGGTDFACFEPHVGDELIVALYESTDGAAFQLVGPGSFFVVDEGGMLSPELDGLRSAVPEWRTPLIEQTRGMSGDELMDLLRDAAEEAGGD